MKDWKKLVSTMSAIAIVILLIALAFSLQEGQSHTPCNRLDSCCYGEDPDFRYHFDSTTHTFKMWEKIDRNLPGNITLFELWHYANGTSLFFDNTTGYTKTALSLNALRYYVAQDRDLGLVSREGFCWIDRMVEYLE